MRTVIARPLKIRCVVVNKRNNELAVCGFKAVSALSKRHKDKIQRLYFTQGRAPYFKTLCRYMASEKKPYNVVEPGELERLSGSFHNQGVVAMIERPVIPFLTREDVLRWADSGEHALLLDRVGNANNLGAIVRSAAFFGVKNIILPLNDSQAFITTSAYRVAEGGMEAVEIYSAGSSGDALSLAEGHMARIGSALNSSLPASKIKDIAGGKAVMLVLGNEEKGIEKSVCAMCDALVVIPPGGNAARDPGMQSLNVAQAASVLMYELTKVAPLAAEAGK